MPMMASKKIGIVGCGTIGQKVAVELDKGSVPGSHLTAISSRNLDKVRVFAETLETPPLVVELKDLVPVVDLVVEAATGDALEEIAYETLSQGKDLLALSCGALLERDDLFDLAQEHGATIYIPSGAIAGLDGVASAAAGRIDSIRMITRKPPSGLKGAPGVLASGVDLETIVEPTVIFDGPVKEACKLFPANVNVSAALSMAGVGPHETTICIYADPTVDRNTHEIQVEGEFGKLTIKIENVPSSTNPKTGVLSALSALATLKRITGTVRVGT